MKQLSPRQARRLAEVPDEATALPRVFVIGFNKCGTTSLHALFKRAGHRCAHFKYKKADGSNVKLAEAIFANREAGQPLLTGLERARVFSDMELNGAERRLEAYTLFREFDEQYPGSRFILNLRDKDKWLRSRMNQGNGGYAAKQMQTKGADSREALTAIWSREWDEHLAAVRAYFADKPGRLVEFNIETDEPRKLVEAFPGYGLDEGHWGKRNANPRISAGADAGTPGRRERRAAKKRGTAASEATA